MTSPNLSSRFDPGALAPGSLITVFGASGFLGRHLVGALARRGYRVRAAMRRPNQALFLKPMGDVGQIELVQANIRDEASCAAAIDGADAVINLVGILFESGRQRFAAIHQEGAERLARLSAQAGLERFVQLSALGAETSSTAAYARSKAGGEAAVLAHLPTATIVRPSIIFGPEDEFFNRFAALARLSPALPLIGGGQTRFQPVYVKDVADAIAGFGADKTALGCTYEFGGPQVATFAELMAFVLEVTGRSRALIPVPASLAKFEAFFLQLLPNPLLTVDQVELLKYDNVVSDQAEAEGRTLKGVGLEPASYEAIVPSYLYRFRRTGQFGAASGSVGS